MSEWIVLGIGTGRCGTNSLAAILDAQPDARVTHEALPHLPWESDAVLLNERIGQLRARDARVAGDVAFYYLPYVRPILEQLPDARVVCLRRDRAETVRSYLAKADGRNHWMRHDGSRWRLDPIWDACYPKYERDGIRPALEAYWDEYYSTVAELEAEFPHNVRLWEMEEALNTREGLEGVLDFVGLEAPMVEVAGTKVNTTPPGAVGGPLRRARLRSRRALGLVRDRARR